MTSWGSNNFNPREQTLTLLLVVIIIQAHCTTVKMLNNIKITFLFVFDVFNHLHVMLTLSFLSSVTNMSFFDGDFDSTALSKLMGCSRFKTL